MAANPPQALSRSTDIPGLLGTWALVLACAAIACAVFGFVFQREIAAAVRVWGQSTAYNHCFLVLPLAGVLLWNRREMLGALRPSPSLWALALLPVVSAVWLGAALLDVLEAEELAALALFEVLLLVMLGWRTFRALLAPLLFLFFLVPFGAFLVPVLQRFTAGFAAHGLELLGIPTYADGFVIQIPEGSFEVAEACAGLRFLIASVVFGCFFATIVYRSKLRRTLFIALSIFAPIVANGFRALGLILLAHLQGSAAAVEADHVLYGWLFFTIVTLVLIGLGLPFAERPSARIPIPAVLGDTQPRLKIAGSMAAALVLALVGPMYLAVIIAPASASSLRVAAEILAPRAGSGWYPETPVSNGWEPLVQDAATSSTITYRRENDIVTELVAAYPLPTRGSPLTRLASTILDDDHSWHTIARSGSQGSIGPTPLMVNSAKIERTTQRRLVWWFYVVDGQITASTLQAKLFQARTALSGGSHYGAFVAISAGDDQDVDEAPSLVRFMQALSLH